MAKKESVEKAIKDIRRKTRRRFSAEEKIRIVMEGMRGEDSEESFLVIAFVSEGLLQRYHGRRILAREHWKAS